MSHRVFQSLPSLSLTRSTVKLAIVATVIQPRYILKGILMKSISVFVQITLAYLFVYIQKRYKYYYHENHRKSNKNCNATILSMSLATDDIVKWYQLLNQPYVYLVCIFKQSIFINSEVQQEIYQPHIENVNPAGVKRFSSMSLISLMSSLH